MYTLFLFCVLSAILFVAISLLFLLLLLLRYALLCLSIYAVCACMLTPETTSGPLSESRRPSYHSRNPSSSSLMGGGGAGSGGSGASASALPLADPISRSVSMTSVNSCDFPEHRHLHHHHQCLTGGPGIAVSNRGPQQQIIQQSAAQCTHIRIYINKRFNENITLRVDVTVWF